VFFLLVRDKVYYLLFLLSSNSLHFIRDIPTFFPAPQGCSCLHIAAYVFCHLSFMQLSGSLLNPGHHVPALCRLTKWRFAAWTTLSILYLFRRQTDSSFLFCFAAENYLALILTGILFCMQGYRQALYYLMHFSIFFLITGNTICTPLLEYSFTPALTKSSSLMQAFLFSRSMGKKIKLLIREKETARFRSQQAVEARKKAEAATRAKSEFLANMSHDIRTPMNAVIGFSDLLADMRLNEQQQSYVRAIRSGGKNLLTLINNILDLSKIEAQKVDLRPEPIRIRALLDEIRQVFFLKMTEKQLSLSLEVDDAVPDLLVLDSTQLRRILFNLVGNAVKFTQKGYVRLTMNTEQTKHQGTQEKINLMITVEDTGPGIPADLHEIIFDPFQQDSANPERNSGTGLGLAITRHLAELMNGEITFRNRTSGGSIFTVRFLAVPVIHTSSFERKAVEKTSRKIIFQDLTILIADDLQEHRDLLRGIFSHMPIQIIEAKNGQEAVDLARKHQPDAMLLDIRMPEKDGCATARQMRKNKKIRHVPIIAITALALQQDQKKIMAEGLFDGFLAKPIQQTDLLKELARFVPYAEAKEGQQETLPITPPAEGMQDFSCLIQQLQTEILPLWKEVCRTKVFSDIEHFAEKAKRVGKEYSCTALITYGDNLKIHSCNFAVEKMKTVLYAYPELIKQLTSTQQNIEKKEEKEEITDEKNTNTDC